MKEIMDCIGNLRTANSNIFSTLDLTSGFLQLELPDGKGQFHWITSPIGLLGCPETFQRLMVGILRDIKTSSSTLTTYWSTQTHMRSTCKSWVQF
jgi:hypothetical protein